MFSYRLNQLGVPRHCHLALPFLLAIVRLALRQNQEHSYHHHMQQRLSLRSQQDFSLLHLKGVQLVINQEAHLQQLLAYLIPLFVFVLKMVESSTIFTYIEDFK